MIILLLLAFTLSAYLFYKQKTTILDFSFYYSLYLFLSIYIRGWFVLSQGSSDIFDHIGFSFSPDLLDILLICIASIASQVIVYHYSPKSKPNLSQFILDFNPSSAGKSFTSKQSNLLIILALIFPLYVYSYLNAVSHKIFYTQGVTTSPVTTNNFGQIISDVGVSGYQTLFLCLGPLIATILAIVSSNYLISTGLGFAFTLFNFSAGSYRLLGVSSAIALILSLIYLRPLCVLTKSKLNTRNFVVQILLIVPILIFGISSFSKAFVRSWFWKESVQYGLDQKLEEGFKSSDLLNSFHCFDSLLALFYSVPRLTEGYSLFVPNLRLLIWPIPRQMWPDKPVIPDLINLYSTGKWAPLTLGFLGDAYKNLSFMGIVICSALIAVIFRYVYAKTLRALKEQTSLLFLVAYICTLSYISVFLRDGGSSWGIFIIPLWIFIWLLKPLMPKPAQNSSKFIIHVPDSVA